METKKKTHEHKYDTNSFNVTGGIISWGNHLKEKKRGDLKSVEAGKNNVCFKMQKCNNQ